MDNSATTFAVSVGEQNRKKRFGPAGRRADEAEEEEAGLGA